MELKDKLQLLEKEIENNIKYYELKHNRSKRKAYIFRLVSVSLGALITVLLGISIANFESMLKNLALVFSSLITIINAIDSFYDYRSLWIKNTMSLFKLRELRIEVRYYSIGTKEEDLEEKKLDKYMDQLKKILRDDIKEWLRLREKISTKEYSGDGDLSINQTGRNGKNISGFRFSDKQKSSSYKEKDEKL